MKITKKRLRQLIKEAITERHLNDQGRQASLQRGKTAVVYSESDGEVVFFENGAEVAPTKPDPTEGSIASPADADDYLMWLRTNNTQWIVDEALVSDSAFSGGEPFEDYAQAIQGLF